MLIEPFQAWDRQKIDDMKSFNPSALDLQFIEEFHNTLGLDSTMKILNCDN